MSKVVVGMSGGVDSAVSAYLLKKAGHEVIGMTLRTRPGNISREIEDARAIAQKLDIPYYAPDCTAEFDERVKRPFFQAYIEGRTPNPCIVCNSRMKWERLLHYAGEFGADFVATGHYASVVQTPGGRWTIQQAEIPDKDQAYVLYRLTQEQLSRTLMPLGKYSKTEVRQIAADAGIPVAQKKDSQEICFVTEGTYTDYIENDSALDPPGIGNFVSEDGKILGEHRGIIYYTVGQRRGLGIAFGTPMYVKRINAAANEVVLGDESSLYSSEIRCGDLNFMSIPDIPEGQTVRALVKIRYHHAGEKADISRDGEGTVRIVFDKPVRAATPGQSAVFYDDGNRVIGGGVIL